MITNVSRDFSCSDVSLKDVADIPEKIPPMQALLVVPIPKSRPRKVSIWKAFLGDLSFMLPSFGTGLGILLALGQAPFLGATLVTTCSLILALRIHTVYNARRERLRMAALEKWYRAYCIDSKAGTRKIPVSEPSAPSAHSE
ncbi:MAG: hypothetical protein IPO77_06695 [Acidobacteria bacterium]|nr:hypothetical protein [Acidobacteriota bacterium]